MPMRRGIAAVLLASALTTSCGREAAPPQITCDKLRGLKVGLPIEDARRVLGSPPEEWRKGQEVRFGEKTFRVSFGDGSDTYWTWDRQASGVRLHLYFLDGRLTEAHSYIRTMWRDFFDNESRPTLFSLKTDGTWSEGADFRRIYCP